MMFGSGVAAVLVASAGFRLVVPMAYGLRFGWRGPLRFGVLSQRTQSTPSR